MVAPVWLATWLSGRPRPVHNSATLFSVHSARFKSSQCYMCLAAAGAAYLNGSKIDGPYALGYTSGVAYAVGEYNGGAPSSYSMQFGSGSTPWQYTVDRTNWITISSATNFNGGGWNITSLPSPFTIYR